MTPQPLLLGLIGADIAHSLSPQLHQAALRREGLQGSYQLLHAPVAAVAQRWIDALRAGTLTGANVTTPWKSWAAERADSHLRWSPDGWLSASGPPPFAVNTLWLHAGLLTAASTDGPGLVAALQAAAAALDLTGAEVVVLGSGGAAQSIVPSLLAAGAAQVALAGRDPGKALAAAAAAARATEALGMVVRAGSLRPVTWRDAAALTQAQLVIHASRVGHGAALSVDGTRPLEPALAMLPWAAWAEAGAVLADLVYAPTGQITAAEAAAQRIGMPVLVGIGRQMLAAQAALAFQLWTGRTQQLADWQAVLEA